METIQAEHGGFCRGVKDAVDTALRHGLQLKGTGICTLGPLVHNPQVQEKLSKAGIACLNRADEIPRGWTVIVRTHGVGARVLKELREKGNNIVDATCPIVRRAQRIVAEESLRGKQVIIVGDEEHPEVVGLMGWAGDRGMVMGDGNTLPSNLDGDPAVVAQTTFMAGEYAEIAKNIKETYPQARVYDTICKSTVIRQEEAARLAKEVDLMLVIGGSSSSNTRKLTKLCRDIGTKTYQVASSDEIDSIKGWAGVRKVGVTAGASTPEWTIKEVIGKMENKEPEVVEEQEGAYQEEIKDFEVGERVEGKVVQVNPEEILVDIGYKSEGILPVSEIYLKPDESPEDIINPGDVVEVLVKKVDDEDGTVILSKKSLDKKVAWHQLEAALETNATMRGNVKEAVQAGIIIDLGAGLEGFMPGSLVDLRYVPDFNEFTGKEVEFKVIEINPEKLKVILSRKRVLEAALDSKKKETLEKIKEGEIIKGEVKRLTDFGAFVDVGGIDGLVHISEISWKRIDHPRTVLKVGEEVQVKVLEVIPEKERIGLSLRQAQPDPWTVLEEKFSAGSVVTGKVTRLVNFGAFVELLPGVEGLAHISQLADYHVKHPQEVLQEGQEIQVKILDINMGSKRISLSVKEAQGHGMNTTMTEGDSGSGVTLGDVFGDLFDQDDKEK